MQSDWLKTVEERFQELLSLQPDWDSYGANAIEQKYLDQAKEFLEQVMREDTAMPALVPLADGGVQLEWHVNGFDVEICFSPEDPQELYIHEIGTGAEIELPDPVQVYLDNQLQQKLQRRVKVQL